MKISLPVLTTGLWLISFFCSFTWLAAWEPEYTALTFIFLICALALSDAAGIKGREWTAPYSPVLIAGGAFWALTLVSVALSEIPFVSWIYFFHFSVLPLTIAFFLVGPKSETRTQSAEKGLMVLLAGLGIFALYQYFFRPDMLMFGRVHAPLYDPNGLAAVFSLGLFLSAKNFLSRGKAISVTHGALVFLLLGGLIVAGSRGALLALLIMGAVLLCAYGLRRIEKRSWVIFAALAGGAIAVTALMASGMNEGPLKLINSALKDTVSATLANRFDIWSSTLLMIKAHPWFGTGIGTFYHYYPEVRAVADTTAGYMAHNDPLQFAAEIGVGGLVLFYVVVGLAIKRTVSAMRRLEIDDPLRLEILAPACGLGALVLHAHLTFNFHVLPCLMLGGFAFALWYRATALALAETPLIIKAPQALNDFSLQALFLIMAFVMSILAAAPVYTQRLVTTSNLALNSGDLQGYMEAVNLADTLSAGMNAQAYLLAARLPLAALAQTDAPLPEPQRQEAIAKVSEMLATARRLNPRYADAIFLQANLAAIQGDNSAAENLLREALRINPLYLPARLLLANHAAERGGPAEELEVLRGGVGYTYRPDMTQTVRAYYLRTIMALQVQGLVAEAAEVETHLSALPN